MLRGLNRTSATIKGVVHKSYSLTKGWPHGQTASVIGHNNLFNGQWWPLRICALRDGAHGAQESGIYGKPGVGAIAVAVAEGGYEDRDYGSVSSLVTQKSWYGILDCFCKLTVLPDN